MAADRLIKQPFPFLILKVQAKVVSLPHWLVGHMVLQILCSRISRLVRLSAGMKNFDLFLYPGESVRTPMIKPFILAGRSVHTGAQPVPPVCTTASFAESKWEVCRIPACQEDLNGATPLPCNEYTCLDGRNGVLRLLNVTNNLG